MVNSFTGNISTNGNWETIESLTVGVPGSNFTGFNKGLKYNMCIQNTAEIRIGDAIFPCQNIKFDYTPGDDDIYIKTNNSIFNNTYCILTILESSQA